MELAPDLAKTPSEAARHKPSHKPPHGIFCLPVLLCIALPWLNPFAGGPSPATVPLLISLACVGMLMLLMRLHVSAMGSTITLFFIAAYALLALTFAVFYENFSLEHAALLVALLAMAMCACVGVGIAKHSGAIGALGASGASGTPDLAEQSRGLAKTLAWAWLLAALANAVIGLCQIWGWSGQFAPWMHTPSADELLATGNLRQRNQLASLCSIGFAALLYLLGTAPRAAPRPDGNMRAGVGGDLSAAKLSLMVTSASASTSAARAATATAAAGAWQPNHPTKRWSIRLGAALALLLLAMASAASLSRVGLVQWLAMTVLCALWWRALARPVRWLAAASVPLYALCSAVLPIIGGPGLTAFARLSHEVGCSGRSVLYRDVWGLVLDKPWLGWGWRELAYAHYSAFGAPQAAPRFCDILDNAHNLPLHVAVEFGLPAASALCLAALAGLYAAKPWRQANPLRQMAWLVLLVTGLHSLTEYPLWYGPFQMAFGLAVGLVAQSGLATSAGRKAFAKDTAYANEPPKDLKTRQFIKKYANVSVIWSFIAMVFILFAAYAAWDYQRVSQIYLPPEERLPQYAQDTMAHVNQSFLFQKHARFAQLMLLPPDLPSAPQALQLASGLLHFSPEPRVIERLIEAAILLGQDDLALLHMARYRAAYPKEFALWQPTRRAKPADPGATEPAEPAKPGMAQ